MNDVNYYHSVGKIIKDLRLKKGLSKVQLADGICSAPYISRIENGDRCPTSIILRQITNRLGVSPEYLFSLIESPNSVLMKLFIEKLVTYGTRRDFITISKLIEQNQPSIEINSKYDQQVISTMKYMSDAIINNDFSTVFKDIDSIIDISNFKKHMPTDVEFAMLALKAYCRLRNNDIEMAYEDLLSLRTISKKISFVHLSILAQYYIYFSAACIDNKKLNEAIKYLNIGIEYCKRSNLINPLRELYFLKGETFHLLNQHDLGNQLIGDAYHLHQLISYTSSEDFIDFAKQRSSKYNPPLY